LLARRPAALIRRFTALLRTPVASRGPNTALASHRRGDFFTSLQQGSATARMGGTYISRHAYHLSDIPPITAEHVVICAQALVSELIQAAFSG
jgi:hypothetical protein